VARVLLFGWLFFWIVGIVQPCCMTIADSDDHDAMSQTIAREDARHAEMAGSSGHENDQCEWAFAADTAPLGDFSPLPTKADSIPHLIVVSDSVPFSAVPEFSSSFAFYHPPPPPRIYVRTQRLLI